MPEVMSARSPLDMPMHRHLTASRARQVLQLRLGRSRTRIGLEAITLLCCICLSWHLSLASPHPIWSVVASGLFIWLCTLMLRVEPRGTVLLLPVIITRASVVVSLIAVEYGAKLPELGLVGSAGSAATSYVFFMALLFAAFTFSFRYLAGAPAGASNYALTAFFDRHAKAISTFGITIAILATLYLCFQGLRLGFPLLSGMDRFAFRRFFADPLTVNILNCKSIIALALGMITFVLPVSRLHAVTSAIIFVAFIAINFLFGDKFFIILSSIASFVAPYLFANYQHSWRNMRLYIPIALLAMVPVLTITWLIYSNGGRESVQTTALKLTDRFAAQGELWYLQVKVGAPPTRWDSDFVARNIEALTVKNVDIFALRKSIGPAYFMNRYSPDNIRIAQGHGGGLVTYTMALEPLALAQFGWFGLACVLIFTGALLALAHAYLARAIKTRSIISAGFSGYILLMVRSFASQGTPWLIFSVYTLKWLSVILAVEVLLMLVSMTQVRRTRILR